MDKIPEETVKQKATCSKCGTKYVLEGGIMSHPAIKCELPEKATKKEKKDFEGIYCMMCLFKSLPKLNFK